MFPTISIGPLSMPTPGLMIIIGVWAGLSLGEKLSPRFRVDDEFLYNLVFLSLIAGIVGARLAYIATAPNAILSNPLTIISLNITTLDPAGGIAIGSLAGLYFTYQKDMLHWRTLDALGPLVATLYLSLGFSHLASGNAYGIKTDLPWGIKLWNAHRHPTQIYEILLGLLAVWLIWRLADHQNLHPGQSFFSLLVLLSAGHLLIAGFRADLPTVGSGIRTGQLASYAVLATSLFLFGKTFPEEKKSRDS